MRLFEVATGRLKITSVPWRRLIFVCVAGPTKYRCPQEFWCLKQRRRDSIKCGVTQFKVANGRVKVTSAPWRRWISVCGLTYQTSLSSPRINYPLITISSEAFAQSESPIDMDLKLNTFLAVGIVATIGLLTGCGASTSKPSIGIISFWFFLKFNIKPLIIPFWKIWLISIEVLSSSSYTIS